MHSDTVRDVNEASNTLSMSIAETWAICWGKSEEYNQKIVQHGRFYFLCVLCHIKCSEYRHISQQQVTSLDGSTLGVTPDEESSSEIHAPANLHHPPPPPATFCHKPNQH